MHTNGMELQAERESCERRYNQQSLTGTGWAPDAGKEGKTGRGVGRKDRKA